MCARIWWKDAASFPYAAALSIFSVQTAKTRVRIEFFDDEIDSIRTFDAGEQRSLEKLQETAVYPCREILFDEAGREKLADSMKKSLAKLKRKKEDVSGAVEHLESDLERLAETHYFASLDKYVSDIYGRIPTIFDWFGDEALYCIDEPRKVGERAKSFEWEMGENGFQSDGKGCAPTGEEAVCCRL